MYRNLFKDIFDFYLAIILFIFFFPLMAFIYVIYINWFSNIYKKVRVFKCHLQFLNLKH